jgi:GNAT superfamily N-acetyltransferase
MALRFRLGGEDVIGAYSVGAMTDPAYQGRGLFVRLGRHLYASLERRGFAFVAGFSNRNSHRLMTGPLGRTPIGPFPWCVRLLSPLAFARALIRTGSTSQATGTVAPQESGGVRIRALDPDDPGLDALWKRVASTVEVGCVRDAAFGAWRYATRPDAGYRTLLAERGGEPAAAVVHRALPVRGISAAFLLDIAIAPGEEAAGGALLRFVHQIARSEGSALASALLPGSGPARTALRRAGYLRVPERLHPQLIRFSVRGLGRFAGHPLLANPRAWHLNWADTDVV